MATYYGTYGQKVQYLASDPSDPQIGQVWYNSTSATLKCKRTYHCSFLGYWWNTNTARSNGSEVGIQTAALIFGW
jgi:hypothetical protein